MMREELLQALRRVKVNMGSFACLGCGYEHGCSVHGCAIIKAAVREINLLAAESAALREERDAARRAAMTPQRAVDILRNANLGGELRLAADAGIEALEREIDGESPGICGGTGLPCCRCQPGACNSRRKSEEDKP